MVIPGDLSKEAVLEAQGEEQGATEGRQGEGDKEVEDWGTKLLGPAPGQELRDMNRN